MEALDWHHIFSFILFCIDHDGCRHYRVCQKFDQPYPIALAIAYSV
ncbi:hypothetical protein [Lentibacillus sp.]|nr:hypothetical protein [Lentibacillus sp.]HLS10025.1 hypothetical protein [Lentibacillus sp.]